jgi:hypothetical protein
MLTAGLFQGCLYMRIEAEADRLYPPDSAASERVRDLSELNVLALSEMTGDISSAFLFFPFLFFSFPFLPR